MTQLLGLPGLGVPRVDDDPGLADLVDPNMNPNAPPPGYQKPINLPSPPAPPPMPHPLPKPPVAAPSPLGPVLLNNNKTLPAPNDAPLPNQATPPHN